MLILKLVHEFLDEVINMLSIRFKILVELTLGFFDFLKQLPRHHNILLVHTGHVLLRVWPATLQVPLPAATPTIHMRRAQG